MNNRTYNKWFSIEKNSSLYFSLELVYDKNVLHLRKQCYIAEEF